MIGTTAIAVTAYTDGSPFAGELLHEQVSKIGLHYIQWSDGSPLILVECRSRRSIP
jgi:hypothetical protein